VASPIRVDFQVGGIKNVLEAFRSVIQAQRDVEAAINRQAADEMKKAAAVANVHKKSAETQEKAQKDLTQVTQSEQTKRDNVAEASGKKKKKVVSDEVAAHANAEKQKTATTQAEQENRVKAVQRGSVRMSRLIAMHQFRALSPEQQQASLARAIAGNANLQKRFGGDPRALSVISAPFDLQEIAAMRDWQALKPGERNSVRKSLKAQNQLVYLPEEFKNYQAKARDYVQGSKRVTKLRDDYLANEQKLEEGARKYLENEEREKADAKRKQQKADAKKQLREQAQRDRDNAARASAISRQLDEKDRRDLFAKARLAADKLKVDRANRQLPHDFLQTGAAKSLEEQREEARREREYKKLFQPIFDREDKEKKERELEEKKAKRQQEIAKNGQKRLEDIQKRTAQSEADAYLKQEALRNKSQDTERRRYERYWEQRLAAEDRHQARIHRQTEQARRVAESKLLAKVQSYTSAVKSSVQNSIGTIARVGGLVTGVLGGFSVADSVERYASQESEATGIELVTKGQIKGKELRKKAAEIGTETGLDPLELLKGYRHFIDIAGVRKAEKHQGLLRYMGQVSLATQVPIGAISEMAARLVAEPSLESNFPALQEVIAKAAGVGRKGSIDITQFAQYGGRLVGPSLKYADKDKALRELLALAEIAANKSSSTTPAEIMIALPRIGESIVQNSAALIKAGINPYEPNSNKLRPISQLAIELIQKSGGAEVQTRQLIKNIRGFRALEGLEAMYNDALEQGKNPLKVLEDEISYFADDTMTAAEIQADAARKIQDATNRMAMVMNELREKLANEIMPVLDRLLPKLKEAIPDIVKLVELLAKVASFIIENPKTAAAGFVGGNIAYDVAGVAVSAFMAKKTAEWVAAHVAKQFAATAAATGAAVAGQEAVAAAATGAAASVAAFGTAATVTVGALLAVGAAAGALALKANMDLLDDEEKSGRVADVGFGSVRELRREASQIKDPKSPEAIELRNKIKGEIQRMFGLIDQQSEVKENQGSAIAKAYYFLKDFGDLSEYNGVVKAAGTPQEVAIKSLQLSIEELSNVLIAISDKNGNPEDSGVPLGMRFTPTVIPSNYPMIGPLRSGWNSSR